MDFSEYRNKKNDKNTLEELSKKVMNEMIRLTNEQI